MSDRDWWEDHPGDITTRATAEAHDAEVAYLLAAFAGIPRRGWLLDLGCGVGRLSEAVSQRRRDLAVVGVDVSRPAIEQARNQPQTRVIYLAGDGWTVPVSGHYAGAWSVLVLQHLDPDTAARLIGEAGRVLGPGGVFVCQFVPPQTLISAHGPQHHEHRPDEVEAWCVHAGLDIVSSGPGPLYPLWHWVTARRWE